MNNDWFRGGTFDWTDDSIRISSNPSQYTKNSYMHIQEIGYFKAYLPYYTERINLDSYLIIYTNSGEGTLNYKGKNYYLKSGTVCFLDCNNYQYYGTSRELWDFHWVHINGKHVKDYYIDFIYKGTLIYETIDSTVKNLIEEMLNLQKYKTRNTELIIANKIVNLLTHIIIEANNIKYKIINDIPIYVFEIQEYFKSNYSSKITLNDLAKMFAINKFQLSKEFKNYVGVSPIEYLIDVRINNAKNLLKYTCYSINEISEAIGIDDSTHFINLFKARIGVTPLKYRKKWN